MIKKRSRSRLPIAGVLLYLAMVMVSTMALAAADWADHLALIPLVGLLGALVGMALARSLFGGRFAAVIATVYGLFVTFWLFGETLDPAFNFREQLIIMGGRFRVFLGVIGRGMDNQDPLMVVLLLSFLYWGLAVYGAWALFRKNGLWAAVLPLGFTVLINAYYYLGGARLDLLLAFYILLGLLLFLYQEIRKREIEWQAIRSRVPANAILSVARAGAAVALLLVLISWAGPAFAGSEAADQAWQRVSGPWRATRDHFSRVLYSLRSPVLLVGDEFSDSLTLEAGVEPADTLVMEVAPEGNLIGPGRYYWRARTYDSYQNGAWEYTGTATETFNPREGDLDLPEYASREPVKVHVAPHNAVQRVLYLPPHTLWVDRTTDLRVQRQEGQIVDVTAYLSNQPVYRGEVYEAESLIAVPEAPDLRSAGEDYPSWITERYLQVPEEMSDRTKELARRIAGDLPTPYDKAEAITAWLRTNIEYQRATEAPPEGREPIDWFIFDYGVGFCNYYASAEVMMLRSLGVPARMAVGYARGEFDPEQALYSVTAADYHAWPEVYFPGYGWVEFEPTVSQAPLIRPEPAPETEAAGGGALRTEAGSRGELDELRLERMDDLLTQDEPLPEQSPAGAVRDISWGRLGVMALLLVTAGIGLWTRLDAGWRLTLRRVADLFMAQPARTDGMSTAAGRARAPTTSLERNYLRWVAWWSRLGLSASRNQTPMERAEIFAAAYPHLAEPGRRLAAAYVRQRFDPSGMGASARELDWPSFQYELWREYGKRIGQDLLHWLRRPDQEEG